MTTQAWQRPEKKINAAPLTEADKYDFLPYIPKDANILPSEVDSYKTDSLAKKLIQALQKGKNLSGQDFTGVNLKGADLSGANLSGICLAKANLTNTNLTNANLMGADLSYAYMENACMDNADLTDVSFKGVFYKKNSVKDAKISPENKAYLQTLCWLLEQIEQGKILLPELPAEQLHFMDFRMLDMSKVDTSEIDLSAFVLDGVNLSGTHVSRLHLKGIKFLMELQEYKEKVSEQQKQKALHQITIQRAKTIKSFADEEMRKEQKVKSYTQNLNRPDYKIAPWSAEDDIKTSADFNLESEKEPEIRADPPNTKQSETHVVGKKKRKWRARPNLNRRV